VRSVSTIPITVVMLTPSNELCKLRSANIDHKCGYFFN
jgi:hypothetical protein